MTDYMAITTELPPYFFFPWFLMEMDSTLTGKLTYAILLDRARLSQLNSWTDEAGRIYIIFPIEKIAKMLGKSLTTAKSALAELEAAWPIERKRQQFSQPNHIYVKLPDGQKFSRP